MASATATASLTSATDVADGATVDFTTAKAQVTAVMVMSGTITGGAVVVQASHDGVAWVHVVALHPALHELGACSHDFSGGAYRYWRSNVYSAITGGGSVTVTFAEAG